MSKTVSLLVDGAGCQSCVNAIEGALRGSEGIEEASFDLASKTATVKTDRSIDDLIAIIDEAGYDAQPKV